MNHVLQVFQTVLAFAAVVLLCVLLKRLAVVREDQGPIFAGLLTQGALPVVIFTQLVTHPLALAQLWMVLAMMAAIAVCLALAWALARALKLDRPRIGALMMTSAFGSSTLIGYPLVQYAFPNNPGALADAVLISELGVGLPIFTLCVAVAMHFGETEPGREGDIRQTLWGYFRSPIFIATAAGLLLSPWHLNPNLPFLAPFFEAARMIGGAVAILSCLILGLQLNFRSLSGLLPLVVIVVVLKMLLQPWLSNWQAVLYHLSLGQRQILVLESAMPSAILASVFATHYRCAGQLTSNLIFISIMLNLLTLPVVFAFLCP
jgi:predicted permease